MKPLLPNTKSKTHDKIIVVEIDHVITDSKSIAESFTDIINHVIQDLDFDVHPSVSLICNREQLDDFDFTHVDIKCVQSILEQLNPRKSVGMDNISSRLRRLSSSISVEVTMLINHFIILKVCPENGRAVISRLW